MPLDYYADRSLHLHDSMTSHTMLATVVELNEGTKRILWVSHQVSLRALDAVVRSTRAGPALRGFVAVSSQMRDWSRELHAAVRQVSELSAAQICNVSALLREDRRLGLLELATPSQQHGASLLRARQHARMLKTSLESDISRISRDTTRGLEELQQLGLMASVLSRAALIEATSGNADERSDLSEVAREFAKHADEVTSVVQDLLSQYKDRQP